MGITLDSIKNKMLNHTFGKLTVLEYMGKSERGDNLWVCKCDCGKEVVGRTSSVTKPNAACRTCKVAAGEGAEKVRTRLLDQVFGRLRVLAYDGQDEHHNALWKCQCECGNEISTRGANLLTGVTKSCGCYSKDRISETHTTHGLSKHPLYAVWHAMLQRCYNSECPAYQDYGERGIAVSTEWKTDFLGFYNWAIENGYEIGLTIDRRNNDLGYFPDNCRWVRRDVQSQNQRSNKVLKEQIREIRDDPRHHRLIALDYNVHESTVSRIKAAKTWSNIKT